MSKGRLVVQLFGRAPLAIAHVASHCGDFRDREVSKRFRLCCS